MTRVLLSVVLPYFDGEATIAEAMDSVLAERDVDLELVVVDNGGRDRGMEIVRRGAKDDARVVVTERKGVPLAEALAHGVAIARGELIARMDQDDVSLPGRFRAQIELLEADRRIGVAGARVAPFPEERVSDGLLRYVAWQNA